MTYRRFKRAEIGNAPATVATFATVQAEAGRSVANVANVAGTTGQSAAAEVSAPSHPALTDEDHHVLFEERAAILEYDEGLSRDEAERLARAELQFGQNGAIEHGRASASAEVKSETVSVLPTAERVSAKFKTVLISEQPADASRVHLAAFVPVTGPGVTVGSAVVELPPAEYDAVLDGLIAEAVDKAEADRLQRMKRKGEVVDDGTGRRVFTRGRL